MDKFEFVAQLLKSLGIETDSSKVFNRFQKLSQLSRDNNFSEDACAAINFGLELFYIFSNIPEEHRQQVIDFAMQKREDF